MKKIPDIALIISLVFAGIYFCDGSYWYESWAAHWMMLLCVLAFWISVKIATEVHWSLALVFFYTSISGISVFSSDGYIYSELPLFELVAYKVISAFACYSFIAMTIFFLLYRQKLHVVEKAIMWLAVLDIPWTYYFWWSHGHIPTGLGGCFGNPSMNLCFLSMMVFVVGKRAPYYLILPYFIGLTGLLFLGIKLGPIAVLITSTVAFLVSQTHRIPWKTLLLGCALASAYLYFKDIPLDSHGRAKVWEWAFEFWEGTRNIDDHFDAFPGISQWFGSGNGTAALLVPHIQQLHNDVEGLFMWMHSDFLQVLFEQGFVGMALYIVLGLFVLRGAFAKPHIFATAIGMFVTCLGNYPMRMALQAMLATWIVFASLEEYKALPGWD